MLEVEPSKRPDIYQVAHLVFQLAQQACPIANINVTALLNNSNFVQLCVNTIYLFLLFILVCVQTSETVDFDQLSAPLTESEWRKSSITSNTASSSSSSSQATAASASSQSGIQSTPVTTVNPRERPKASQQLSAGVPAIPLVVLSNNNANGNKHQPQHSLRSRSSSFIENSHFVSFPLCSLTVNIPPPLPAGSKLSVCIRPNAPSTTTTASTATTIAAAAAVVTSKPPPATSSTVAPFRFEDDFAAGSSSSSGAVQQTQRFSQTQPSGGVDASLTPTNLSQALQSDFFTAAPSSANDAEAATANSAKSPLHHVHVHSNAGHLNASADRKAHSHRRSASQYIQFNSSF